MHREYQFYIYIVANYPRTVFYVGVCNNLIRRTIEHTYGFGSVFTKKYHLKHLVYYEVFQYINTAIEREKEIKKWRREKKLTLIKSTNPDMHDFSKEKLAHIDKNELQEIINDLKWQYKT